ncbi:filamentous hemagglutinin N-terminal domain-containing protein [Microcoleus sp. FACHB-SPT15]|uniref:two-partner secretion domain-containing protein n=1 Tax=Microcoleus sp. FACHB-SPT15 TaxID=2692830 RepID=UPI0017843AC5|nr:filamentous hemagglutinin N-terminal domain-containing protein [Microcoleus sp. FACHB-SPT15]MBD1806169.1 filamentous hemagglutinin N-terminal domain-containing protein [Microcoleus sp. FACHB-SPT15]
MAAYLLRNWQLGIVGFLTISGVLTSGADRTLAQITPDATLGAEGSVVTPGVDVGGQAADRIDGGATRGINLFHSFFEFNVGEGQRVYFANPVGIENILTRVTGTNASNILGTLGLTGGTTNLFLINPNGIIFGSNARLDISGSFFASTASSFEFADGSEFSANNPTAPPLLTVNVTPGLQWGTSQPGATISNTGNLASQQDLILVADKLDLQGQLQAGRDLTLQAQETVKVRDSLTTPFVALAGGNLTIQGNQGIDILALNHPTQTPFVSGGNLSLISDGTISGDARFSSGGSFSISSVSGGLVNFVSLYDPIVSAEGDVDVAANYTGASLLVEATGNIRFQGDINITGPDTSTLPPGLDTATLSNGSALIMRSGQETLAYGGVNTDAVPNSGTGAVPEGITIGGDVVVQPFNGIGGIVSLTAASGNVSTQLISTNGQQSWNFINATNGGAIRLKASNGSVITGDLLSYSRTRRGDAAANGGAISLEAANDININGDLNSGSYSTYGDAGNGGTIRLEASNDINITGDLLSYSRTRRGDAAANGGAISLEATNGSITTGLLSSSSVSVSGSGNAANGGAISLEASNDININGGLDSYSSSVKFGDAGSGGAIHLEATNGSINTGELYSYSSSKFGDAGSGGAIHLEATNGSINTGELYSYSSSNGGSSGNAGNGGAISLEAANDININGGLDSYAYSFSRKAGNGGAISLKAANGSINTNSLYSYSYSGSLSSSNSGGGNGGAISIEAANDINITGDLYSYSLSQSGDGGNGGAISIEAVNGSVITDSLYSYSYSSSGDGGNGGAISIEATNGSINTDSLYSFFSYLYSYFFIGKAGNGGAISIEAANDINITGSLSSSSYSFFGNAGNGGAISLTTTNGTIAINPFVYVSGSESSPTIDASGASGGNITLTSPTGIFELKDGLLNSNASSGNGGNIQIEAASVSLTNTELTTTASGVGNAGSISIFADGEVSLDFSRLFTSLELGAIGNGGDITLDAGVVSLTDASFIDTATFNQGNAGNVLVKVADSLSLDNNSAIFSITAGIGNGGNVTVEAGGSISLANGSNISTAVNPGALGDGGDINITARALSLTGGSQLVTSTSSSGAAGNITVNTTEDVTISGVDPNFTLPQPINVLVDNPLPIAEVESNDEIAQAQPLTQFFLNSPNDVNPNVELSTRIPYVSVEGTAMPSDVDGDGFDNDYYAFEVTAAGTRAIFDIDGPVHDTFKSLNLLDSDGNELISNFDASPSLGAGGSTAIGDPYLRHTFSEPGTYFIRVDSYPTGAYTLNVSLETPNAATSVVNGQLPSGLFAQTEGAGVAGNVTINTPQLSVFDGGNISATATEAATSTAQGGSIEVNANLVNLQGSNSGLFALTEGAAPAGSLTLQPYNNEPTLTVNLQQGAQVSASTTSSGQGGTLTVTAPDSITLSGNGSFIAAETSGSGIGGDLTLETGTLTVRDEAKVTVSSTGTGNAGNLNITANSVLLDNGQLIAETASGEGGNINLTVEDLLSLRNNSQISAQAGQNGNGGNLAIDAQLILAVPGEDSDIVADAEMGNGGNIDITTSGLFGLEYRDQRTPSSDITASSRFGISGTVNVNGLAVDPSRGLTNLPTAVVDASNQIDQTCAAGGTLASRQSRFVVTGSGGLPDSPDQALSPNAVWEDLRFVDNRKPSEVQQSVSVQGLATTSNQSTTNNRQPTIVEAKAWELNQRGEVVLTANEQTGTPYSSWQKSGTCPHS